MQITAYTTNVRVYHASLREWVYFVLGVPHALIERITHSVVVLVIHNLIALGSFASHKHVATTCNSLSADIARNQKPELDERALRKGQLDPF